MRHERELAKLNMSAAQPQTVSVPSAVAGPSSGYMVNTGNLMDGIGPEYSTVHNTFIPVPQAQYHDE